MHRSDLPDVTGALRENSDRDKSMLLLSPTKVMKHWVDEERSPRARQVGSPSEINGYRFHSLFGLLSPIFPNPYSTKAKVVEKTVVW
jgi:hypothetical protein